MVVAVFVRRRFTAFPAHLTKRSFSQFTNKKEKEKENNLIAITRKISPKISQCQLTHIPRSPINFSLALQQHEEYIQALKDENGNIKQVISLDTIQDLPDCVFVEDCAVMFDECGVVTRPGAESRRGEVDSIQEIIKKYRRKEDLLRIVEPGILDGGDVLTIGKFVYVGLSSRSNQAAIQQMQQFLKKWNYTVKSIKVNGCLHLKTAVTCVDDKTLLINPDWIDKNEFLIDGIPDLKFIEIDPSEPFAANALNIGNKTVVYSGSSFPKTLKRLVEQGNGLKIVQVCADELAKAEGALTCCSILFKSD